MTLIEEAIEALKTQYTHPFTDDDELIIKLKAIKGDGMNHYNKQGDIECIDVLEQLAEDGEDFRILNAIKYIWRYRHKDDDADLLKAMNYIHRKLYGVWMPQQRLKRCCTCQTMLIKDSSGWYCPGCTDNLKTDWRVA